MNSANAFSRSAKKAELQALEIGNASGARKLPLPPALPALEGQRAPFPHRFHRIRPRHYRKLEVDFVEILVLEDMRRQHVERPQRQQVLPVHFPGREAYCPVIDHLWCMKALKTDLVRPGEVFRVHHCGVSPGHIVGADRHAVAPPGALVQPELKVHPVRRHRPGCRQPRFKLQRQAVVAEQGFKQQVEHPAGGHSGVQVVIKTLGKRPRPEFEFPARVGVSAGKRRRAWLPIRLGINLRRACGQQAGQQA